MGEEMRYAPLAHLPRSITRQRSLQKGRLGSSSSTSVWQVGHRNAVGFEDFFVILFCLGYYARHHVVVMRFGDFATIELPSLQLRVRAKVIHVHQSVNLGCMLFAAPLP